MAVPDEGEGDDNHYLSWSLGALHVAGWYGKQGSGSDHTTVNPLGRLFKGVLLYILPMKSVIALLCVVLVLWCTGCGDTPVGDSREEFGKELDVSWTSDVQFPVDSLGNPDFMHATGGHLIFAEPRNERLLTVYNPTFGTIARMLPKGRAANEFLNVHQIGTYPSDSGASFFVFDNFSSKIFVYSLSGGHFTPNLQLNAPDGLMSFAFLTPDQMLGCAKDDSRYMRVDTSGCIDARFGDYEAFKLTIPVGSSLLQGLSISAAMPDRQQRYAWFSFYGTGFQIIDSATDSCRIIASKMYAMPEFEIMSASAGSYPVFGQRTPIGYPAVTTDGRYIYALYSGHTLAEIMQNRDMAWRSRTIHVYDWEGNPCLLLHSDSALKTLAYDNATNRLYALNMTDEGLYRLVYLDMAEIYRQADL